MTDPEEFKLTAAERFSSTWARISEHLEARLAECRRKNDGNLSFDETTKLRGQIKELQYLLAVGIPDEPVPMADHDA
jgi:hypothetical protein